MTYLAAGVDRRRHNLLLEEFSEKGPTHYRQLSIYSSID